MNVCDLNGCSTRLQRATKKLRERWEETKQHWDDKTCREFEEKYLRPILPEVGLTVANIQRMSETLDRAHRDCDDQG